MKKTIKNRHNIDLVVVVEGEENPAGLAFVVHGLGGFKEQIHIRAAAEAFLENGYTMITYDAANTIGESGGRMEDATLTNYFEDLEDVAEWAQGQPWYKVPFIVSGHSLGGASSLMYAATYPDKVKAIAPLSATIAGTFFVDMERRKDEAAMRRWEAEGYMLEESASKPGVTKKIGWGLIEDLLRHDMRTLAHKIVCPALFVTGADDVSCAPGIQRTVIEKMPHPGDLRVIEGMGHDPRSKEHNQELKDIISAWLKNLE